LPDVGPDEVLFDQEVTFDNGNRLAIRCCSGNGESAWVESILFDAAGNELVVGEVGESVRGLHQCEYDGDTYKVWVAGRRIVKRYALIACDIEISDTDAPFFEAQPEADDISSDCNYDLSYDDKESGLKVIDTELQEWVRMRRPIC
jgi:hypothetical protein